jgi:cobalt-zinc-cadmium efflux system outer membrane protein
LKISLLLLIAVLAVPATWSQQTALMTLDQALARARIRAPQTLIARERIEEARGRLAGASVRQQDNPVIGSSVGPRFAPTGDTVDFDVSLSQQFEMGGRRAARIAGASAGIERETATSRNVLRQLLRDVGVAFSRALAAKERLSFATTSSKIADELLQSMERRYQAGDVPILDVNLARNSSARARADVRFAQAAYTSAVGDLRILLGMSSDEQIEVAGNLRDRRRYDLASLMEKAGDRPDLRALEAERKEAQADVRVGNGYRSPTVAPALTYKRDQGDNVIQGGVSFTLPVFNRGQELQAVGLARTRRIDQEIMATERAVSVEVRTAYEVYNLQVAAVEELEREALPGLEENETLARKSFEEGEIGLAELLLIRRDALDLRTLYTERLLEAAVAGIELETRAGVLQ